MTLSDSEIFDPNNWDWSERQYTIWTPRFEYGFQVDYVDYVFFSQWLWDRKVIRRGGATHRKKMVYCSRNRSVGRDEDRRNWSMYLHIEIMKRTGIEPATPEHVLVDHIDGDTFNCTRINLQWATYAMNRVRGSKTRGPTFRN